MKVMVVMAQKSVCPVMNATEVMQVAEMASRPVRGIEMMASAAGRKVTSAERTWRRVRHAGVRVSAAENPRRMADAGMRRHHMANARMPHRSMTDAPMNHSAVTAAEVRTPAKMLTADVSCSSDVSATDMASADVSADVTDMSSARVPAGMSAPAVTASMSSAMLGEKWIRQENADARAQQDGEPD